MSTGGEVEERLRELMMRFWSLRSEELGDDLQFSAAHIRRMSSVRFLTFVAAVESNLGVRVPDPGAITTYGKLREVVLGDASSPAVARGAVDESVAAASVVHGGASVPPIGGAAALAVGIGQDIEEVSNLPESPDYAGDPFYARNFTADEIAYCVAMGNPRQHFAARLCAKEALVKSSPMFAGLDYRKVEVVSDENGRPSLRILDEALRRALNGSALLVSLSHTETMASAVVLMTDRSGQ